MTKKLTATFEIGQQVAVIVGDIRIVTGTITTTEIRYGTQVAYKVEWKNVNGEMSFMWCEAEALRAVADDVLVTNIYHIDAGIRGFWNTDDDGIIFYADQNTSAYISAATPAAARISFIAEMNERGDNALELDDSMTVVLSGRVLDKKMNDAPVYYDQPALPTDEDLRRILATDYPTKEYPGGQHRQAGKLNDFFSALNAQVIAEMTPTPDKPTSASAQLDAPSTEHGDYLAPDADDDKPFAFKPGDMVYSKWDDDYGYIWFRPYEGNRYAVELPEYPGDRGYYPGKMFSGTRDGNELQWVSPFVGSLENVCNPDDDDLDTPTDEPGDTLPLTSDDVDPDILLPHNIVEILPLYMPHRGAVTGVIVDIDMDYCYEYGVIYQVDGRWYKRYWRSIELVKQHYVIDAA